MLASWLLSLLAASSLMAITTPASGANQRVIVAPRSTGRLGGWLTHFNSTLYSKFVEIIWSLCKTWDKTGHDD